MLTTAIEAGAVRLNHGLSSNDYQGPAGSASARYGFTNAVTIEAHAEGAGELGMGGAGATVALGSIGLVSASGGASNSFGQTGYQYGMGFQRQTIADGWLAKATRDFALCATAAVRPSSSPATSRTGKSASRSRHPSAMAVSWFYRPASNGLADAAIQAMRRTAMGAEVPMFAKGSAGARGALAHLRRGGCWACLWIRN